MDNHQLRKSINNITFLWMISCFVDMSYVVFQTYDPDIHNTLSSVIIYNPKIIYVMNIMSLFTILYETTRYNQVLIRLITICYVLVGCYGILRTSENTIRHDLFAVTIFSGIMVFMFHTIDRSFLKKLATYINIAISVKIILKKMIQENDIFTDECMFVLMFALHYCF